MDIAILFSEDFPVKKLSGQCYVLSKATGVYTLGRNSDERTYDIDIPSQSFSRSQATLTFSYNAYFKSWMLSDAGLNEAGELIPYQEGCQVNGVFIPRNERGVPDPHAIDPEFNKRILIGGDPNMKILVLPECEATVGTTPDPFNDGLWGSGVWTKKAKDGTESPQVNIRPQVSADAIASGVTVGLDISTIEDPRFRSFVAVSKAAGYGLANPETRLRTLLTMLSGMAILAGIAGFAWVLTQIGLNPLTAPPPPPPVHDSAS